MNDNFLQENPLALFDDFVQIPNEAFDNDQDLAEIYALIEAICESEDYSRVLARMNEVSPSAIEESKKTLLTYYNNALAGEYGATKKKDMICDFMSRAIGVLNEIQAFGGTFKHQKLKVCKMSPDAILPKYKSLGDAGADIYTLEDVVIEPGRTELVRTGIKAVVPGGYKLEIVPRSGISATTKVRVPNTPGTIDCEYRDEIKVIVENCGDEPVHFSKSSRIAQMILVPIVKIDWEEVSESEFSKYSTNRGKGFGSSGLK